jgi:hypothetical protein
MVDIDAKCRIYMEDMAKRWLAHDGLWFQAVERAYGLDEALRLDTEVWEKFTVLEAQKIMKLADIKPGGGLPALKEALQWRLYAFINQQEIVEKDENTLIFKMINCRVQSARERKGMELHPCKPVGLVEYAGFASAVDPRIKTKCLGCPPDKKTDDFYCSWEFSI